MLNLEKFMSSTVHAHAQGEIQSKPRDTQPDSYKAWPADVLSSGGCHLRLPILYD